MTAPQLNVRPAAARDRELWLPDAVRLRRAGLTTNEIASHVGVGRFTISAWLPSDLRHLSPRQLQDRRQAVERGVDHSVITAERLLASTAARAARLAARRVPVTPERRARSFFARQRRAAAKPLSLDLRYQSTGRTLADLVADGGAQDPAALATLHELERAVESMIGTTDLDDIASLAPERRAALQQRLIALGLAADHREPMRESESDARDVWQRREMSTGRIYGHAAWLRGAPCDDDGEPLDPDNHWRSLSGYGRARCICGALSPELPNHRTRREWIDRHVVVTPSRTDRQPPASSSETKGGQGPEVLSDPDATVQP